jgi:hypothetical protein
MSIWLKKHNEIINDVNGNILSVAKVTELVAAIWRKVLNGISAYQCEKQWPTSNFSGGQNCI